MSEQHLKGDNDETIRWLRWLQPHGPWVVTSIGVDRNSIETATFDEDSVKGLMNWLNQHNGKDNCYFMVNPAIRPLTKKASKEDVKELAWLHVDCDPPNGTDPKAARAEILARLQAFEPMPSAVIDSGGGYQAFWRLDEPLYVGGDVAAAEELEAYNQQLELILKGDHCHNIDRIMRLPGTWNIPNAKKKAAGRVERVAAVVGEVTDLSYPLGRFTAAPKDRAHRKAGGSPSKVTLADELASVELDELPDGVSPRIRKVIREGRIADSDRYPSRSEAVCGVTRAMVRAGCDDYTIAAVLLDARFGISESIIEHGTGAKAEAAREIANAREDVGHNRPRIIWSETELARCLDETEAALLNSGIQIYAMGDRLVQPVRLDAPQSDSRQAGQHASQLVVSEVRKYRLLEHMLTAARFVKLEPNKDGDLVEKPYAPAVKFAEHLLARVGAWRLPVLAGIVTTPTMRPDGSIVAEQGYDPSSRLIVDLQGEAFPPVPEAPTYEDARMALDVLVDIICEFPFESDDEEDSPSGKTPSASRSVALAMILTAIARSAFRTAPMFGISAPTMATGKSLLADVPAMIVSGRSATKMSQGANEEEDEKRFFSVLLQCDPIIVIDNIARPVSGDSLCTILTEPTWRCRMLGRSEMREVGTKALVVATGNNLAFREDMSSRAVLISLDAELENPGEREFQRDLRKYVLEHRAELTIAALTVLRGYIAAGRPRIEDMRPTRFDEWDVVRAALMWLDEPDPWATSARVATGDNARSDHIAVMSAIAGAFGFGTWVSTTEIVERPDWKEPDEAGKQLQAALSAALPHGVSAQGVARYLTKFSGRRVEGMWIKVIPNPKKGGRYAIMTDSGSDSASSASSKQSELGLEDEGRWVPCSAVDHDPEKEPY